MISSPPDLFASFKVPPSRPPDSDLHPTDPALTPRQQDLRFPGDLYTPQWIRGHGNKREGWCGLCQPGRWLVLKNSAFWYDKYFVHGICAATGAPFPAPLRVRCQDPALGVWEGLCASCGQWISLLSNKKKGRAWFRHAYKCQSHLKPKLHYRQPTSRQNHSLLLPYSHSVDQVASPTGGPSPNGTNHHTHSQSQSHTHPHVPHHQHSSDDSIISHPNILPVSNSYHSSNSGSSNLSDLDSPHYPHSPLRVPRSDSEQNYITQSPSSQHHSLPLPPLPSTAPPRPSHDVHANASGNPFMPQMSTPPLPFLPELSEYGTLSPSNSGFSVPISSNSVSMVDFSLGMGGSNTSEWSTKTSAHTNTSTANSTNRSLGSRPNTPVTPSDLMPSNVYYPMKMPLSLALDLGLSGLVNQSPMSPEFPTCSSSMLLPAVMPSPISPSHQSLHEHQLRSSSITAGNLASTSSVSAGIPPSQVPPPPPPLPPPPPQPQQQQQQHRQFSGHMKQISPLSQLPVPSPTIRPWLSVPSSNGSPRMNNYQQTSSNVNVLLSSPSYSPVSATSTSRRINHQLSNLPTPAQMSPNRLSFNVSNGPLLNVMSQGGTMDSPSKATNGTTHQNTTGSPVAPSVRPADTNVSSDMYTFSTSNVYSNSTPSSVCDSESLSTTSRNIATDTTPTSKSQPSHDNTISSPAAHNLPSMSCVSPNPSSYFMMGASHASHTSLPPTPPPSETPSSSSDVNLTSNPEKISDYMNLVGLI